MRQKRPEHQRMLNSKRWQEVRRQVWLRAGGLCEQCKAEGIAAGVPGGYVTPGKDCHHVVPFESAKTIREAEQLCYDVNNVRLLCIPCHIAVHKEMGKNTKQNILERQAQAFERWKDRILKMGTT